MHPPPRELLYALRLSAADRRAIVESILDISVFSTMNLLLKERQAGVKERLREVENGLTLIREKIDLQTIIFMEYTCICQDSFRHKNQLSILNSKREKHII